MRYLALAALLLAPSAASADITVLTSGGTQPALKALAAEWTRISGNMARIVDGTVKFTVDNLSTKLPADVVLLPSPSFEQSRGNYQLRSVKPIGRVYFGLAQKAGQPKPNISSLEKFVAVLKSAKGVGYTDPNSGSAAGKWVSDLLARPEFAGVDRRPITGMPGWAIARYGAQYALGPISEEVAVPGVEAIGRLPEQISKHFDYSAAVLAIASQPKQAADFLAYITRPDARAVWKKTGLEPAN